PAFTLGSTSFWVVDARALKDARNIGEAEAMQRHFLRGEAVSWCGSRVCLGRPGCRRLVLCRGLFFVILPYLIIKVRASTKSARLRGGGAGRLAKPKVEGPMLPYSAEFAVCFWKEHTLRPLRLVPDGTNI